MANRWGVEQRSLVTLLGCSLASNVEGHNGTAVSAHTILENTVANLGCSLLSDVEGHNGGVVAGEEVLAPWLQLPLPRVPL